MTYRKKLIEVALPLDAINAESAREKSIRHGHPSTLHLWWARRPLAACRAVLFASLVDDPAEPAAPPAYLAALDALPKPDPLPLLWDGMTVAEQRRERLFAFIARLVKWENSNDERIIGTARELINLACEGNPPPVLDPFCGGGSIPLEAQRLGLEAHASDLNPVAVLITKALIEIPPKFANRPPVNPAAGNGQRATGTAGTSARSLLPAAGSAWKGAAGLAADVRYYGKWMRDEAERRIGHLYPKAKLLDGGEATVIAWLWARTVRCPNPACGAQMPLVRSFALSTKPGKQAWAEPLVDRSVTPPGVRFTVKSGVGQVPERTVQAKTATCLACGVTVSKDNYVAAEGKAGKLGVELMAVVAEGNRQRIYLDPDAAPVPGLSSESSAAVAIARETFLSAATPNRQQLTGGTCRAFGLDTWGHVFTARQLVALTTFSDLVSEAQEGAQRDAAAAGLPVDDKPLADGGTGARAYGEAVATYLGLGVSRLSDICNALCRWENTKTQVRNLFARQAIPMMWDFAEPNAFARAAGDYIVSLTTLAEVIDAAPVGALAQATQVDATVPPVSLTEGLICTDPPYYDNIGYAVLSDFFYVWLRRSLRDVFPDLFSTLLVPKSAELVATPYRFGGSRQEAEAFFREGLGRAFHRMRLVQSIDFPLTTFYAFKQAEADQRDGAGSEAASTGWETMLTGLIDAGFAVTGTWPVRSELGNRMVASGTNALASSIVLVCRPRPEDAPAASRAEFLEELGVAMRSALPLLASGQVAPVDLAQASIGPGMAAYSKYSSVVRQDGRRVSVREALQDINNAVASYRNERVSSFDSETHFCLAWYEQRGYSEAVYGLADDLARTHNVGPEAMQRDGLLAAARGRVRLEPPASYPAGVAGLAERPFGERVTSAWEACLRLAITLEKEGETGAAALARELGEGAAARARELAVWLYTIADAKKRSDDAYLFNALDASWAAIQEQVARQSAGRQAEF